MCFLGKKRLGDITLRIATGLLNTAILSSCDSLLNAERYCLMEASYCFVDLVAPEAGGKLPKIALA